VVCRWCARRQCEQRESLQSARERCPVLSQQQGARARPNDVNLRKLCNLTLWLSRLRWCHAVTALAVSSRRAVGLAAGHGIHSLCGGFRKDGQGRSMCEMHDG
jgi:hypothetical protein